MLHIFLKSRQIDLYIEHWDKLGKFHVQHTYKFPPYEKRYLQNQSIVVWQKTSGSINKIADHLKSVRMLIYLKTTTSHCVTDETK